MAAALPIPNGPPHQVRLRFSLVLGDSNLRLNITPSMTVMGSRGIRTSCKAAALPAVNAIILTEASDKPSSQRITF